MARNTSKTFPLRGGEDFVTSDLMIPDGMARFAENFEQDYNQGYTKMAGYRHYLDPAQLPGEAEILGLFSYNNYIYMYRKNVGVATIGLWRLTPAWYLADGTMDPLKPGSALAITDIRDSAGVATTLPYNGQNILQTIVHNFKATSGTAPAAATYPYLDFTGDVGNAYGADGVNPAWEFDGTTIRQLNSTYTPDNPRHITASGNRLLLGFRSGEIAVSVAGDPTDYNPVNGAGSFGVTDHLTGMHSTPDGTVYIYTRDKSYLLKGVAGPLADATLNKYSRDVGCQPYTNQVLGDKSLSWDTYGLTEMEAVDKFGDIAANSISNNVQYLFDRKRPRCSSVLRDKSQYRAYFLNESTAGPTAYNTIAITATLIEGGSLGITHATFPFVASVCEFGEVNDGNGFGDKKAAHVMGTLDGEVFIMDEGTSYDGASFTSILSLPYTHMGSPNNQKKFRKVSINVDAAEATTIQMSAEFSYGRAGDSKDVVANPSGALWATKAWSDFIWGAGSVGHIESYLNGHGENVSVTIASTGDDIKQYTLKDITFTYQQQRINH